MIKFEMRELSDDFLNRIDPKERHKKAIIFIAFLDNEIAECSYQDIEYAYHIYEQMEWREEEELKEYFELDKSISIQIYDKLIADNKGIYAENLGEYGLKAFRLLPFDKYINEKGIFNWEKAKNDHLGIFCNAEITKIKNMFESAREQGYDKWSGERYTTEGAVENERNDIVYILTEDGFKWDYKPKGYGTSHYDKFNYIEWKIV